MRSNKTRAGMALLVTGALVVGTARHGRRPVAGRPAPTWPTCRRAPPTRGSPASKAEMDKIAAENGITITEFDAQFNPDTADDAAPGRHHLWPVRRHSSSALYGVGLAARTSRMPPPLASRSCASTRSSART